MKNSKRASQASMDGHRRPPQVVQYIDKFLDAACDSSRRSILELLIPPEGQEFPEAFELRAGEIADKLGLAASTTSEHLHHLLKLHLVSARKQGTMVFYRLRNHHLVLAFHELLEALENHYHTQHRIREQPEAEEG